MNKLMFVASGVAIGALMTGCSTTTSVTYGSDGEVVLVESSSKERMETALARLEKAIESSLREQVAQKKFMAKYPIPSNSGIEKSVGFTLTANELKALKDAAEKMTRKLEKAIVWPAWIEYQCQRTLPVAEKETKKKNYETARELIWLASTTPVEEVNEGVRERGIEFLNTRVNPVQWAEIEKDIREKMANFIKEQAFEEANEFLKNYPRIRTYSKQIDKRFDAIRDEIVRLGVDKEGVEPISEQTSELVAAAAKIVDLRDSVTNTITKVEVPSNEKNLELEEYERKLEDYRRTLVKFNCTEENAQKIVDSINTLVSPLLDALKKNEGVSVKEDKKEFTYLGTMAVNRRIDKLVEELKVDVRASLKKASTSNLKEKVAALLADGKYDDAREVIWQAAATGDPEVDALVFVEGLELLRNDVNPAHWIAIETEIKTTVSEKIAADDYDGALAFLQKYPRIRQHSVMIDDMLARVREEAEALGVSSEEAEKHTKATCAFVEEVAKLVDHMDEKMAGEKPSEIDEKAYKEALNNYKSRLELYHVEPAKAQEVVTKLDMALRAFMRKPGEPAVKLALGTNAVNDRMAKLIAEQTALVEQKKGGWQTKQFDEQCESLIKRVREATAAKKFAEARDAIRDVKLVEVPVADAKLYALRIGLLNSVVNPRQLAYLLEEIKTKSDTLIKAKDFEGLKKFIEEYPYVHDTYEQIQTALENIKSTMMGMSTELTEGDATKYIVKADEIIANLLEAREGRWSPDFDLKALETALDEFSKALLAHYYKQAEVKAFCLDFKKSIVDLLNAPYDPITTSEVNAALEKALEPLLAKAEAGILKQNYLALLAQIDQEVSIDAQIAMAEEAISRQLGIKCEKASFKVNAVLGEYARAFRLLKKNAKLTPAEATSLILGAAYLDQPAVIPYAQKLGADINGSSARDVRKRTALMLAIDAQNLSLMKALVEAGASSTVTDATGNTVLHYAVKSGSVAAVRAIAKVASMTVVNDMGETPLFEAVKRNQQAMVQTVIDLVDEKAREAFVNTTNKRGLTAFALAAKIGARDVLDPLAKGGATYSEADLILAEEGDHIAIAQWLVAQGVDVNADGVMAKACPATAVGRYLIHEGGVGDHTCKVCQPEEEKPAQAAEPQKKVEAAGTITFNISDNAAK